MLVELEEAAQRHREHPDRHQGRPEASRTQPEDIRAEHSRGDNLHKHQEGLHQGVHLRSIEADSRGNPEEAYRSLGIAAAEEAVAEAEHQVERPGEVHVHVEDIQALGQVHRRDCECARVQ